MQSLLNVFIIGLQFASHTHIMNEFSLQEADRFQGEQVVDQERVGVFESTDDASKDVGDVFNIRMRVIY